MKKLLLILLAVIASGCNCAEDEDFTPYPGGKAPFTHDQKSEKSEQLLLQR